ncbi:hypothetical protein B0H19DRAFT_1083694 [Mycena capillaripes]|nr:hypothetical protein B0H19DRAFT_1083694 [Mycena capillaripes]
MDLQCKATDSDSHDNVVCGFALQTAATGSALVASICFPARCPRCILSRRHAGTFSGPEPPGGSKRAANRATVQAVAASKFVQLRAASLSPYQSIHPHVYSANISQINPLKDGHFVLAMKAVGTAAEIVLGQVLTMYAKNTNHDWVPSVDSVGAPSYIYVQTYRPLGGGFFTSMSCEKLGCPTFLQIPRTHILFSLASFSGIHRQEVNPQLTFVTLCKESFALYEAFHRHR